MHFSFALCILCCRFGSARILSDPLYGTVKYCTCKSLSVVITDLPVCANEGGTCACEGEIFYGMKGVYTSKVMSGRTGCTNGVFGDPLHGTRKECRYGKKNLKKKMKLEKKNEKKK